MSLRPLLAEINDLLERKEIICSDGRRQRIDICLCGDLKVPNVHCSLLCNTFVHFFAIHATCGCIYLTILGFAQAKSNHSCIWCCIHSNDQYVNIIKIPN